MKPAEIDWGKFEAAVRTVCEKCLAYLDANPPEDPVYGFGFEGGIEQGLVYVSANTESGRSGDAEWWLPDWNLTYLDERLGEESCDHLFAPFAEPFQTVLEEGSFDELCRLFRLACLRALKSTEEKVGDVIFPRSFDFSIIYMDEAEAYYQGSDEIAAGIKALEATGR